MTGEGDEETILGSKRITAANFTAPDIARTFGDWIAMFSEHQLASNIPEPVRRLFELARGTMTYGWLYYPLLTLGYAECTRVLEAGARRAAALAGLAPSPEKQRATYEKIIDLLHQKGHIANEALERWNVGRQIRNSFAHPTTPTILLPSYASSKLRVTAEQLNELFSFHQGPAG